jgi:hypothetical protein
MDARWKIRDRAMKKNAIKLLAGQSVLGWSSLCPQPLQRILLQAGEGQFQHLLWSGPRFRNRGRGVAPEMICRLVICCVAKDSGRMPKPGDAVHIPLPTDEAIRLALRVKPTAEMPRHSGPSAPGCVLLKSNRMTRSSLLDTGLSRSRNTKRPPTAKIANPTPTPTKSGNSQTCGADAGCRRAS